MIRKLIFVLIFVLILQNVSALGLTPTRADIDFSPGLQKTISFSIVNSERRDINIVLAVQGELAEYISLSQTTFSMTSEEKSRSVSYTVNLPNELEPGMHTAEILVLQLPTEGTPGATYVGAALALVSELIVQVPYPGKYVETNLLIYGPDKDGKYDFVIPSISRGKIGIESLKADIKIIDEAGKVVTRLRSGEFGLNSGERKDIGVFGWVPNIETGNYIARATVFYDNEIPKNLEKSLNIGGSVLSLVSMEVNGFSLGNTADFEATIRNNAEQSVQEVFSEMEVYSEDGDVLAKFKSATYDINSGEKAKMHLFWDTAGVSKGTYPSTLFLNYPDGKDEIKFEMIVSDTQIIFNGLFGYVIGRSTVSKGFVGERTFYVLIGLIVVLVLINLVWFLFLRKRMKRKRKT